MIAVFLFIYEAITMASRIISQARKFLSIESMENRALVGITLGSIPGVALGAVRFHLDHPKKFNNPLEAGYNYGFVLPTYIFFGGLGGAALFGTVFAAAPITFPCITYGIIREWRLKKIEKKIDNYHDDKND